MGAYIYSIICAAVTVAVLCALAPEKEELSKYIAFAGALAVALCILHPISGGAQLSQLDTLFEAETSDGSDNRAAAEYAARNAIIAFCAVSGVDAERVSADVEISDSATSVTIRCGGSIIADIKELEAKLSEMLGLNVTVCEEVQ